MNRSVTLLIALGLVQACSDTPVSPPQTTPAARPGSTAASVEEYVLTPGGKYHRSCVHQVPSGSHIGKRNPTTGTKTVTRPDSARSASEGAGVPAGQVRGSWANRRAA